MLIGPLTPLEVQAFLDTPRGLNERQHRVHQNFGIPDDLGHGNHEPVDLGDFRGPVLPVHREALARVGARKPGAAVPDLPGPFLRVDYPHPSGGDDDVIDIRLGVAGHLAVGEDVSSRGEVYGQVRAH